MLVECLKAFLDLDTKETRAVGERFEVTPERLSEINSTRYGQLVSEVAEVPSSGVSGIDKPRARRGRKPKSDE
jgi:hypothetical protein